ncbi:UvrD-helicase domain-containing protein [Priestia flexa]|uniref:DNA 3'-5' helicase n=1 Tax=Priestia flexa TaxID=86664 RepID=A0ABU4JB85_9BACI|nr:ATP-dependent helicase [Priestia flexa]MDW8518263.1 ATP-dependent helicase [Priestia flexa]QCS54149.1 ATP-dependent helicase [Priestia flexa]
MNELVNNWIPSGGLRLEQNALSAVKNLDNSLVVAGPGAGKTELLAQKACFLLETNSCSNPKRILAISFKKDAAANLKDRVDLRVSPELAIRFTSKTFDSFAKNIIDSFSSALPLKYRPNFDYSLFDKSNNDVVKAYAKFDIYQGKGMKRSVFVNALLKHLNSQPLPIQNDELLENVWNYLLKGDEENSAKLNFPMISQLALYILNTNPLILKSLQKTYSHVFLDEFQDTTTIQYELVKTCFLNSATSLTAVGDNRQRIMVWAGAKKDVFDCYNRDFFANQYNLIMNHRSAPRLLEIQKVVNDYLQNQTFTPIPNSRWSIKDGISEIWYFKNSQKEAQTIASKINELINILEIPHSEICILVKQTVDKYSKEIINELENYNIVARNETLFQDLLKEDLIILLINTLKSALDVQNSDAWMKIWDIKMELAGVKGSILNETITPLLYSFKSFLADVKLELDNLTELEQFRKILLDIMEYYGVDKIRKYYPQYSQGGYINQIRDSLVDYLFSFYQKTGNLLEAIESFEGRLSIPIMTIHKSKGLEYEAVFFIGFDDNAFWTYSTQEEEDTCTFFVGLSRAKKYLYFTFSERRDGGFCQKTNISPLYNMLRDSNIVEELNFE